ncbi:reverse transcriptase domain-containing protein, partial [Mycobacterium kansasii]
KQPEGYEIKEGEKKVCRLTRSLYGLKQSPKQWYKKFDSFMLNQKFTRSEYDHCVYYKTINDGKFIILLLSIDDMLIVCHDMSEINVPKTQLLGTFEMKYLRA